MDNEEIRKTKDRLSKLLNMTVENGCSEDEAENAMRMAAGLAARIGISLDEVRPAGEAKPKVTERWKSVRMKVYESFCAQAAGELYGVECVAPNYGKDGYWFTGREENIELAEQTMLFLIRQVEQLYKQALPRGLSKRDRANFRGSFKDACGERIYHRAIKLMREMQTNEAQAQEATGRNALVVAGHFKQLRSEVRAYNDEKYITGPRRRAEERRQSKLAAMTEEDRVKFLEKENEEKLKAEKAAKKEAAKPYKPPRHRNPKRGSGTEAGWDAGDRVRLRREIK